MTNCTAQVLRGAIYEACGAPVGADGRCEAGHGVGEAVVKAAEHHRAAPDLNLTPGTWPVTRKFFSVDDHIVEPADVWSKRVPAKFRDAAPHVVEADGREYWEYEGNRALTMGLNAVAGKPRDQWTMEPTRFSDMIPGCYEPAARARDMVSDGITASVCFPTLPRFGGVLFNDFADKALADACVKAWNDFIFEEWCAAAPDLFVPMPICQIWDPVAAAAEIRRNAARGARALCFPEETSYLGLPSFYSDHWDPDLGRGHRSRPPRVHAHRFVGQHRLPAAGRTLLADHLPGLRGGRPERGGAHDEPGAAEVPDGEVRDVGGRHRLGARSAGAGRPTGRPAPVLVG